MNNVINFIMDLRAKGHLISFELNKYGYFHIVEHYNETVNGRIIYGHKKNTLWSGRAEDVGEWLCDDIEAKLMGTVALALR